MSYILRQKLQCDMALELEVFSLVVHAHPASAELAHYEVMRNGPANHEVSSRRLRECTYSSRVIRLNINKSRPSS